MKVYRTMAAVWILRVEGNVGCGKSTLLHHLRERLSRARVVPEPVHGWKEHIRGVYGDESSDMWKLPMQALSACTRAEALLGAIRKASSDTQAPYDSPHVLVVERSDESAAIFGRLTLADPELAAFEKISGRYAQIFQRLRDHHDLREARVYLRALPKTCSQRIAQRSRDGENGIGMTFLCDLHEAHETEFSNADLVVGCDDIASDEVAARVIDFVTEHCGTESRS